MFPVSFLNSILEFSNFTLLKTKAQEMLKNKEITKPVAKMDLALVGSNSPKGKKRYSHKQEPIIGYRRGKHRLYHHQSSTTSNQFRTLLGFWS
ncbi:hypothetical protein YC2023_061571 [Brassica napus]